MDKLGIINCQILELEIAYLLSHDAQVSDIWVIRNAYSEKLVQALENHRTKPVHFIEKADAFTPSDETGLAVLIDVKKVGLHSYIPGLRQEVLSAVQTMAPFVDSIFLGYGLCGNALTRMDELFKDISIPVVMPMDQGSPVDDCVSMIIGGRDAYYEEQCKCAGTMFMNAGFSLYIEDILLEDIPDRISHKRTQIMQKLLEGYKRSLLLPTPVLGEKALKENTRVFNKKYQLDIESRQGTLDLLKEGLQKAIHAR